MSTGERDADVVRRYLRTFATRDLDELRTVVADNVEIYGAGQFVRGLSATWATVAPWAPTSGRKRDRLAPGCHVLSRNTPSCGLAGTLSGAALRFRRS